MKIFPFINGKSKLYIINRRTHYYALLSIRKRKGMVAEFKIDSEIFKLDKLLRCKAKDQVMVPYKYALAFGAAAYNRCSLLAEYFSIAHKFR